MRAAPALRILESLALTPGPGAVPDAMQWFRGLAKARAWPEGAIFKLTLCLDEALNNILMHGGLSANQYLRVEALQGTGIVGVAIIDDGPPFDPTGMISTPLARSLNEAHPGGHGLRLMRHFLQDIRYSRAGRHNRLELLLAQDQIPGPINDQA